MNPQNTRPAFVPANRIAPVAAAALVAAAGAPAVHTQAVRYRVRQGVHITHPKNSDIVFKGGEFIPHSEFSSQWIKDGERQGFIERCGVNANEQEKEVVAAADMPGAEKPQPLPSGPDYNKDKTPPNQPDGMQRAVSISGPVGQNTTPQPRADVVIRTDAEGNPKTPEAIIPTQPAVSSVTTLSGNAVPSTGQAVSIWDINPATLKDKTIDQLNVMIAEKDAAIKPFADKNEAVAWLSQDFVAKS